MDFILGIDQGSTKTDAVVCDRHGQLLGFGRAGGACHAMHGMNVAMDAVQVAAQRALAQVGPEAVALVYAGMTGADWPDEYDLLATHITQLELGHTVVVANDALVALRGGTAASYGAIIVAGTGANCAIRSPGGETFIYGYYLDPDLSGGVGLGRRVLQSLYHAATGRAPATVLTARVLELLALPSVDALLRIHGDGRLIEQQIKQLAPLVFQAAYEGDGVAASIIKGFGEGLAELVTAGLRRFEMTTLPVEVVVSGSIFKGEGALLLDVLNATLHLTAPRARVVNARYEPVVGAALLGLEQLGVVIDEVVQHAIEGTSRAFNLIRVP